VIARLTVDEAADASRRHRVTLYKALQAKALHGTQRIKRGKWLIEPECLDAWIENRQCPHTAVTDLGAYRAGRGRST
jgi:hypothetical protein